MKVFGVILLTVGFIAAVIRLFHKVKDGDNSFIEKVPLMVRAISMLPRFRGR